MPSGMCTGPPGPVGPPPFAVAAAAGRSTAKHPEVGLEGALAVMPPPDSEHAAIASRLLVWLAMAGWPAEQVLQTAGVRIPGPHRRRRADPRSDALGRTAATERLAVDRRSPTRDRDHLAGLGGDGRADQAPGVRQGRHTAVLGGRPRCGADGHPLPAHREQRVRGGYEGAVVLVAEHRPGRPSRLTFDRRPAALRRQASMQATLGRDMTQLPDLQPPVPAPTARFAEALRAAIQASGLSLNRIEHRLRERGQAVSSATLSYWQSG